MASPRVYAAFAIAGAIGLAVFGIWWFTSPDRGGMTGADRRRPVGSGGQEAQVLPTDIPLVPSASPPADAPVLALPRGGMLTGSTDAPGEALTRLTQATLVRINRATDAVEPWLAESWTVSPDNLTYTIKLRPDVRWSDGSPFTVDAVVASLAKVPDFSFGASAGRLAVRALDALTIEVRFPGPFAPGLRLLDRYPIVPRLDPSDGAGLGPFVEGEPGPEGPGLRTSGPGLRTSLRTLVRNPHYWRKAPDGAALPYLDRLTLETGSPGQHDFADSAIAPDDYEALKTLEQGGKGRLFDLGPGLDADALWFSRAVALAKADRPWLTNERFRLAISAAVDRRVYCRQVFFGACDPIAGPVTPANSAWFNPDLPLGRGDPQLAREMLGELGLMDRTGDGILDDAARRPVGFSLLIRRGVPSSLRAATFLAEALRAVGVAVEVTALDATALAARRTKGNYDAIYDRIAFLDTDPAMNLDFWLSTGRAHVWNPARSLDDPLGRPADWERQIDQLMLEHAASFDRIERLQAFAEVQRIYSQHMPALFFGAPRVRLFTSPRVLNATPSVLRPHLLWNAEYLAALP